MTQASDFLFSYSVCVYQLKRVDVYIRPVKDPYITVNNLNKTFPMCGWEYIYVKKISANMR